MELGFLKIVVLTNMVITDFRRLLEFSCKINYLRSLQTPKNLDLSYL